ncbi:MAG: DUF362 domain-containing protein [Nitrososphaerota archaeon]
MENKICQNTIVNRLKKIIESTYFIGTVSLLWFLYRSGTKPSRVTYPCQRAALLTSYNFLILPVICFLLKTFNRLGLSKLCQKIPFKKLLTKNNLRIFVLIFVVLSVISLVTLVYFETLDKTPEFQNATPGTGISTVAIVRVGERTLEEALEEALSYIGGIESIVPEGAKVLIKPNIVDGSPTPTTTPPDIIEALVKIVKRRNPSVVWIAEGSSDWNTMRNFRKLGYFEVANRTGAILVDLNDGELINVPVEDGGIVYSNFTLNKIVPEADVFISVPVMKTHYLAIVTLGMKNLVGIAPGAVYSRYGWAAKWKLHEEATKKNDPYLGGVITDLCKARRIDLTIIDGRIGMEGYGPQRGTPVKMDLIIAGKDPVATDAVASLVMGFDPEKIPSIKIGSQRGLGTNDLSKIEVKGLSVKEVFRPFNCAVPEHREFQLKTQAESKTLIEFITVILITSTIFLFVLYMKFRNPISPETTIHLHTTSKCDLEYGNSTKHSEKGYAKNET